MTCNRISHDRAAGGGWTTYLPAGEAANWNNHRGIFQAQSRLRRARRQEAQLSCGDVMFRGGCNLEMELGEKMAVD